MSYHLAPRLRRHLSKWQNKLRFHRRFPITTSTKIRWLRELANLLKQYPPFTGLHPTMSGRCRNPAISAFGKSANATLSTDRCSLPRPEISLFAPLGSSLLEYLNPWGDSAYDFFSGSLCDHGISRRELTSQPPLTLMMECRDTTETHFIILEKTICTLVKKIKLVLSITYRRTTVQALIQFGCLEIEVLLFLLENNEAHKTNKNEPKIVPVCW